MFTDHNNLIIKAVICNYIDCNYQDSKTNNTTFLLNLKFNVGSISQRFLKNLYQYNFSVD